MRLRKSTNILFQKPLNKEQGSWIQTWLINPFDLNQAYISKKQECCYCQILNQRDRHSCLGVKFERIIGCTMNAKPHYRLMITRTL